ncbi:MAG: hypothetical protein IJB89_02860 [Akkermansia sp.]|nr:hypothetical protein [Akkermansia sp.]
MCKKSNTIAHDLFYAQDSERERQTPGGRFSIRRGKDFTVAYSYSTPIAVYPDSGGFVLLDSSRFSNTTSGHQSSVRRAIPYNVNRIECDWLGQNDIWRPYFGNCFTDYFKKFIRNVVKGISLIGRADSDYAYSRKRNETLERLNRLRQLARLRGTPKSLISHLDRRTAAVSDPKRIKAAQKRVVNRKKEEEKRKRRIREENTLHNNLRNLLSSNPDIQKAIDKAAATLLQRISYSEWVRLPALSLKPSGGVSTQIRQWVYNNVAGASHKLWITQCRSSDSNDQTCDLWWQKDGTFRTSKGVSIHSAELQRCLKLWKSHRLVGEMVDDRYHVLRNDESVLIIGCHCFHQETVHRIWERYAEKSQEQIAREEETRLCDAMTCRDQILAPLIKRVKREYEQFTSTNNNTPNNNDNRK